MWKTVVEPAVLYGCELWTDVSKKKLENLKILQRFAARFKVLISNLPLCALFTH